MKSIIANQYALALYEYATEQGVLDQVSEEYQVLVNVINNETNFMDVIKHPKLSVKEKKEIFSNIMKNFSKHLQHFIYVLLDNGRISWVDEINDELVQLIKNANNQMAITAYSVEPLSNEDLVALSKKLKTKFNREIEINNIVQADVLGGLRLEFNGQVLDDTIKKNLHELKSSLL